MLFRLLMMLHSITCWALFKTTITFFFPQWVFQHPSCLHLKKGMIPLNKHNFFLHKASQRSKCRVHCHEFWIIQTHNYKMIQTFPKPPQLKLRMCLSCVPFPKTAFASEAQRTYMIICYRAPKYLSHVQGGI